MGNLDQPGSGPAPEPQRTDCLSSTATLFWRVFVPIFGTVFLAGLTLALMVIHESDLYLSFPAWWARAVALLLLAGWLYWVKKGIWRLKRVDASESHMFVTNYWHTVRYPWTDVARIEESKRAGKRLVHFHLHAPGRFGSVITILPAGNYDELMRNLKV